MKSTFIKVFLILLVIIVVAGAFEWGFSGKYETNNNISSYLKYTSPKEVLPEEKLVQLYIYGPPEQPWVFKNNEIKVKFVGEDVKLYCLDNTLMEKVDYFSYSPGHLFEGGSYSRYALLCKDNYFVVQIGGGMVPNFYGPFNK